MSPKPTLADGQVKLRRWAEERNARGWQPTNPRDYTRPRGNGDRDQRDLERGIERIKGLLGR
jgi:hypothetical protein